MTDKLVVSKQSWHWKLYARAADGKPHTPNTLCGYFWLVALAPFVIVVSFVGKWTLGLLDRGLERIFGKGGGIIVPGVICGVLLVVLIQAGWHSLLVTLGIFFGLIAAVIGVIALIFWHADRSQRGEIEGTTSTWGLILATIKAKKRKVCPIIEVRE